MSYLVIEPKNEKESKFIAQLLAKLNVKVFTEDEEDAAFTHAMKQVDFSQRVSLSEVKKILRK